MMDQGDVFPVLMYKEQQTKIVLQLAGTSFLTETSRVRILSPKEVPAGLQRYRKNVETYLQTQSEVEEGSQRKALNAHVRAAETLRQGLVPMVRHGRGFPQGSRLPV
jgi:hypothetical protein